MNLWKVGLGLVLIVPFVVTPQAYFPYVFGKAIFFQVLIVVLAITFLLSKRKVGPLNWVDRSLLIFVGILFLSSIFGVDFERSFWSTQERMTGVFFFLHLLVFYFVVRKVKKDWFVKGVVLSSLLLEVLTIIRGSSPFGNEGLLGSYLLFTFFFSLLVWKDGWFWRVASSLNIVGVTYLLWSTESRAPLVSVLVGLAVYFGFKLKWKRWYLGLLLVCALLCFAMRGDFLHGIETRLVSWVIGFRAWKERPLLGWGPENFIYAWSKHFDPRYNAANWFDKAHNRYLELLVTSGVLGFVAYLGLLGVVFWKTIKEKRFVLVSLLVAYALNSFFWFGSPVDLILFFFVLACIG